MKSTLEQYIEPQNIPKKYGGSLEYKFGDLPNLDPSIQQVLQWAAPEKVNGQNTFPTGPIRWQRYENGDLAALAVGSENGVRRDRKIATIHPPSDIAQVSLGAGHQGHQIYRTTSGVDTHPAQPTQKDVDLMDPPKEENLNSQQNASAVGDNSIIGAGTVTGAATAGTTGGTFLNYNAGTTSTIPYRESAPAQITESNQEISNDNVQTHMGPSTDRDGTSHSRYADQSHTHAHGNVAEGTPHVEGSHGDAYSVMEPGTVGQAPKEHPMPPAEEPPAPSYLDQAKSVAGQAYDTAAAAGSSVLAAVGVGGKQEEPVQEETEPQIPHDPAVDGAEPHKVEEFLRSQYQSKEASKASADAI